MNPAEEPLRRRGVEEPPELTEEDHRILDAVWDRIHREELAKELAKQEAEKRSDDQPHPGAGL